ncbi:MAG: Beta-hexosaminidase (EC [uncultured Sulfurovum sp.]|uniref:N-acetylmuramoyl-L-alanine amidase n=1 Tax=uncultured Sulfurovum sp. TaxID=269237 RepID=A0A6S6SAM9_9BACT|nr:MAG: Beta-hexosaminidase (EC [uncultured Sulfurovum sp.]
MYKTFLLSLTLLTLTACAKEVPAQKAPVKEELKCQTKPIQPLRIIDKPIDFGKERIAMTKEYIQSHYGKRVKNIEITPKIIVLHWTAEMSFEKSFARLKPQKLFTDRKDIAKASLLNVSSQFLVARDGTIYRLMPENWMARHVIGLNYSSIGVENVGGKGNQVDDLTPAQRASNIALIKYLKAKHPSIEYLIGHHEYRQMEKTSLWLEKDQGYRTVKSDPGAKFMSDMRKATQHLHLKTPPKAQ